MSSTFKRFSSSFYRLALQLMGRSWSPEPVFTNWPKLLAADWEAWEEARRAARGGPKVLLATSISGHGGVTPVESLLGVALTLRGAEVHYLLCDEFLPACMEAIIDKGQFHSGFVREGPSVFWCQRCNDMRARVFEPLGLPIHDYSSLVSAQEREQSAELAQNLSVEAMTSFELDGWALGEHALAGALRYFARGTLEGEPDAEPVLRRYFHAALLTAYATRNLLDQEHFDVACFHHGIYVPQGIIGEVARQRGLRVVNWNPAYRKQTFIFSHGDTYHHTLMNEPVEAWENMTWTPEMEAHIMAYLKSRWKGSQDWIWFHENPQENLQKISQELGIDFGKPTIGMLTNVMWDAQLHYPANAFPNMLTWVLQTIEYFGQRPDLQLVIRVHPAEIRGTIPSRQKIVDEINKAFPNLPTNVFVIPPESNVSTYATMLQCDSVIIYGTKTGVELTSFGIPVIVAGEAWIRNKGVTLDAHSVEEYFQILETLPIGQRLDEITMRRARMYAYHFFFRRMIPLSMYQPRQGWPPYEVILEGLDDLRPGADPGLDVVCHGILHGTPFIYPAERMMHNKGA